MSIYSRNNYSIPIIEISFDNGIFNEIDFAIYPPKDKKTYMVNVVNKHEKLPHGPRLKIYKSGGNYNTYPLNRASGNIMYDGSLINIRDKNIDKIAYMVSAYIGKEVVEYYEASYDEEKRLRAVLYAKIKELNSMDKELKDDLVKIGKRNEVVIRR